MRHARPLVPLLAALVIGAGGQTCVAAQSAAPTAGQQEAFDHIVARVEGDVILLSEVRELAAYQQLVDGRAQSRDQIIAALIEQWVVRSEAEESRFPAPPAAEVDAAASRIQSGFPSAPAFRERMAAAGLTSQHMRRIVEQQLYLERYLDYKFRPAIQIEDDAVARYYQEELIPALRARGEMPPALDDVRDRIREVLLQRGISERADSWFQETKSRLQIEISPPLPAEGRS